jgi:hypothetical protein
VRAPAENEAASVETRSGSWRQSKRFPRKQALSGRRAREEARARVEVGFITTIAAMGARLGSFGGKGHLCRHQACLDERQAHPERQEKRQEQCSDPMLRRAAHDWYYGAVRSRQQGSAQAGSPTLSTMTLDRIRQAT